MSNGDELAFPFEGGQNNGIQPSKGLTKREYYAAMAMQGFISNSVAMDEFVELSSSFDLKQKTLIARASAIMADEMLKELEK